MRGEIPSPKIYEDDTVFAIADITPKAPTHILVIPKLHIDSVHAALPATMHVFENLFSAVGTIVNQKGLAQNGYRLVINSGKDAHQSVHHLHVHILAGGDLGLVP